MRRGLPGLIGWAALTSMLACTGSEESRGPASTLCYTMAFDASMSLDGYEGVDVVFADREDEHEGPDGLPPDPHIRWMSYTLTYIRESQPPICRFAPYPLDRRDGWRGYARFTPPGAAAMPAVGDIVDVVFNDADCDGDLCGSQTNVHFEMGRVHLP